MNTTKGPWEVSARGAEGKNMFLHLVVDPSGMDAARRSSLIAAAPELLKLLSEQLEMWEKGIIVEIRPGSNFHLNVRVAIAKAEGK